MGRCTRHPGSSAPSAGGKGWRLSRFTRSAGLQTLWFTATLTLVAAQGLLRLFDPFAGDQALFSLGARALDAGGRLYVEFWDNKQPGIYWFYWLGGRLFGFSQEGVRALEIVWVVALATVLMAWLRRVLVRPWLAAAAALAACNGYFAFAHVWELGQLEMLVGLPAGLSAWLLCAGVNTPQRRWRTAAFVAAGACGGTAAVFKLVLAPLFAALAVAAALLRSPASPRAPRLAGVAGDVAAYGLGALVPLIAVVAVFAGQGALRPFLETTFVYPLEALAEVPLAPVRRLLESLARIAAVVAPWLPLAVIGARWAWSGRDSRAGATVLALVWIAAGLAVIAVQKFSWWSYHTWLIAPPVAVLAAIGLDSLCTRLADLPGTVRPGAVAAMIMVIATAATATAALERVYPLAWHARTGTLDVASYRRKLSADYGVTADSVALLPADERRPIYVIGSPLYTVLSGRDQAIPIHGWALGSLPARIRGQIGAMLAAARPGRIFVEAWEEPPLRQRVPEVAALLERDYRSERTDPGGTWFVRKDLVGGAPPAP